MLAQKTAIENKVIKEKLRYANCMVDKLKCLIFNNMNSNRFIY